MGARILTGDNGAATTEPEEPQQRGYEMNDLVGQKTIPLDDPFWLSIMENLDETLEQLDTGYEAMQMIHVSCKRLSIGPIIYVIKQLFFVHSLSSLSPSNVPRFDDMILEQAGCGEKSVPSSAAERLRGGGHHGHRSSKEIPIEISEMAVNLMFLTRVFFKHLIDICEGPKRRKALSLLPISEASSSSSSSSQERGAGRGEVAITIPIRPKESKGDRHGRQVEEEATNGKATNGTALTLERIKAASRDTDLQHRLFVNIIRIITTLPERQTTGASEWGGRLWFPQKSTRAWYLPNDLSEDAVPPLPFLFSCQFIVLRGISIFDLSFDIDVAESTSPQLGRSFVVDVDNSGAALFL
eukprot:jgi/Bigna1/80870/fgenesh1_pg.75_\